MRVLVVVLLLGIAGCGGEETSPGDAATPSSAAISPVKSENAAAGAPKTKADELAAQAAGADTVATLEKLGAKIKRNEQGEVVEGLLNGRKITDAGLVHLKGMTKLESLDFRYTQITDAGLVHLKGMTNLQTLSLRDTKVTDPKLSHSEWYKIWG